MVQAFHEILAEFYRFPEKKQEISRKRRWSLIVRFLFLPDGLYCKSNFIEMDKGVRGIVFAAAFFASGGGKIRSFR